MFRPPSSDETEDFYGGLAEGTKRRSLWGKERRFDPLRFERSPSIERYYVQPLRERIAPTDAVLDIGCGTGIFLSHLAPICGSLTGVDLSEEFVAASRARIAQAGLRNASAMKADARSLPFEDARFDCTVLTDVLHHVEEPRAVLDEVRRVTRPGGRILVFEPNKLNPALFALCLLDRNEWGALALGSKRAYRRLLAGLPVERLEYNGLLLGPDSRVNRAIADTLGHPLVSRWLGWLSPKIFVSARNG